MSAETPLVVQDPVEWQMPKQSRIRGGGELKADRPTSTIKLASVIS